jgi:hypothetical protein
MARWGWRKKLALQLALLPVSALAVEGGYRLWSGIRGEPYDGGRAREQIGEIESSMRETIPEAPEPGDLTREAQGLQDQVREPENLIAHPYFGFEKAESVAVVLAESEEFRRGEHDSTYNVLIVGGSVAGIFGRRGTERLGELLEQDPRFRSRKVRFFGHGRGSFKQPQQLYLVQYLLGFGYRIDCVIDIDGFNELALSNKNVWDKAHPLYPSAIRYAHLVRGGDADPGDFELLLDMRQAVREVAAVGARARKWGLLHSAVLGRWSLGRVHAARKRWAAAQETYGARLLGRDADSIVRGPAFEGDLSRTIELVRANWFECSRSLQGLCDERGITYLHVLQPTMHDRGSKPLTEVELQKDNAHQSWIDAIEPGYPVLRQAGQRLLAEGVHFFDGSAVFNDVEETLYFDACHFRASGNVLLAEAIAPALLAVLPRELPARHP